MRPHGLPTSLLAAAIALLCLPALAQATVNSTWLVGTGTGVAAARAVPGERIAPGIRVVRGSASAARRVKSLPGVRFVEPNRRFHASSLAAPSDPLFGRQWALRSTRAARAWPASLGDGVAVAVLDSGLDLSNPDLAGNVWTNPDEVPGNGQDDDGNGFVDDVHGADTVGWDGNPSDGLGHGTAVASVIAARGDNGVGLSGMAWNARVMPVQVLHDGGWGRPPL